MNITSYDNKVHGIINSRLKEMRTRLRSYCQSAVGDEDIGKLSKEFAEDIDKAIDEGVNDIWSIVDAMAISMIRDAKKHKEEGDYTAEASALALLAFLKRKDRVKGKKVTKGLERQTRSALGLVDGTKEEQARQMARLLERPSRIARETHTKQKAIFSNVRRLLATELAVAYRTAEYHVWQKLPFVVGQEIRPGRNHAVHDICDELEGVYPKDFKFAGWHPWCRCFAHPLFSWESEPVTKMPDYYLRWTKK